MRNFERLIGYFKAYKAAIDECGILPVNQWNFDKIKFCINIDHKDWVISMNILYKIYSKCSDDQESFATIKRMYEIGDNILPILIMTKIQQLATKFNNNLSDDIAVTTIEIRYKDDWISLQ